MSTAALTIAGAELSAILKHCRRELPNEACGILGGRDRKVESVHPVQNAHPSPSRFAMEPTAQFLAMDEVSRAGRELVGIYHSHPNGPAVLSSVDLQEACWPGTTSPNYPGAVQVIVSLQDCASPVVRGYAANRGMFIEVPIIIDEPKQVR